MEEVETEGVVEVEKAEVEMEEDMEVDKAEVEMRWILLVAEWAGAMVVNEEV